MMEFCFEDAPLDLTSALLPAKTKLNHGLLTHTHIHAGVQRRDFQSEGFEAVFLPALLPIKMSLYATRNVRYICWM
jgi:hypothetical protein